MTKKCQELKGKNEEEISDAQSELAPKKDEKETGLTFLLGDDDDGVSSRGEEVDKFLGGGGGGGGTQIITHY